MQNYDVNTMASAQEMRSFVCGQCHVEYHFKGDEKRLTFPWKNGLKAENMYAYYEEIKFKDWTHKETGAACRRPSTLSSNSGIRASTPVQASPAPIATCPTSGRAARKSPITGCGARC
ncbi:MAG: ammonia-forming cytochrome c nitrite reductase subunit c552 [Paludibaculum sp.]